METIKDLELYLKIITSSLIEDGTENELEKAIKKVLDLSIPLITGLYGITKQIQENGLFEKWKVIGLEYQMAKFIDKIYYSRILDDDMPDNSFVSSLRAIYTLCKRYYELIAANKGYVLDDDWTLINFIDDKRLAQTTNIRKRGRPSGTSDFMILIPGSDKEAILNAIKEVAKGKKGVNFAKVLVAAQDIGLIRKLPTYEQAASTFEDIGCESGYNASIKIKFKSDETSLYKDELMKLLQIECS